MRQVLSIICGLLFCVLPLTAEAGLFGRRCNSCYGHAYYPQNILIEQETIIIPRRVTRYNEIPGLQIIEDPHHGTLLVINGRVVDTNGVEFLKEEEEIVNGQVERVRRTQVDSYGVRVITEDKIIQR